MAKWAGLASLTSALSKEFAGYMGSVYEVVRSAFNDLTNKFVSGNSLCLFGGLRGPSSLCPGTPLAIICGCPLPAPFCDPNPFGMFKLPVLMCLKGGSRDIPLPEALPFRKCGDGPLLNISSSCAHRLGGVLDMARFKEGSRAVKLWAATRRKIIDSW
jgi:hypothetical protein